MNNSCGHWATVTFVYKKFEQKLLASKTVTVVVVGPYQKFAKNLLDLLVSEGYMVPVSMALGEVLFQVRVGAIE